VGASVAVGGTPVACAVGDGVAVGERTVVGVADGVVADGLAIAVAVDVGGAVTVAEGAGSAGVADAPGWPGTTEN
jgi:hypothetical protein